MRKYSLTLLFAAGLLSGTAGLAAEPSASSADELQGQAGSAASSQGTSHAGRAKRGELCRGWTTFDCGQFGKNLSVADIYSRGWRVVSATANSNINATFLFIEEQ